MPCFAYFGCMNVEFGPSIDKYQYEVPEKPYRPCNDHYGSQPLTSSSSTITSPDYQTYYVDELSSGSSSIPEAVPSTENYGNYPKLSSPTYSSLENVVFPEPPAKRPRFSDPPEEIEMPDAVHFDETPVNEFDSILNENAPVQDVEPSTSADAVPCSSTSQADGENEEEEWAEYYYQLEDPHADLIEKIRRQMEEEAKIEEEINNALEKEIVLQASERFQSRSNRHERKRALARDAERLKKREVFVCFACGRGYYSLDEMRNHVRAAHLKNVTGNPFKCARCSSAFTQKWRLLEHEKKTHDAPLGVHHCPDCRMAYSSASSLAAHVSSAHSTKKGRRKTKPAEKIDVRQTENGQFICDDCGRTFPKRDAVLRHRYYCKNREEVIRRKADREKEEREQREKRAAEALKARLAEGGTLSVLTPDTVLSPRSKLDKSCPICHLVCASMQSRNRHIQRIHPDADPTSLPNNYTKADQPLLPFVCDVCFKRFACTASLSIHRRRLHEQEQMEHECAKCHMRFPLLSEKRKHELRSRGLPMCRGRGRNTLATPRTPAMSATAKEEVTSTASPGSSAHFDSSPSSPALFDKLYNPVLDEFASL